MKKYLKAKLRDRDIIITYASNDLRWVLATYDTENHKRVFKADTKDLNVDISKLEKLISIKDL
jgi:hypothetical protein